MLQTLPASTYTTRDAEGNITADVRRSIKLVRYQSEKVYASWQDYREHIETMHCG
ncbi:AMMECR1 protein-like [Tropilaelaps mercedesae]|uniref:AMMECR1 protein-like n=1 Tax=Tropilaelaps mercedesae TaxID=418985 RepID=A0A1V9XSG5_9ACAR|nr:AMMECR1 protein-like [Tropilaelaps mercedesae]